MTAPILLLLAAMTAAAADENRVTNGDFEQGLAGWSEPWSRTPGIQASADKEVRHGGKQAVRVEHSGKDDWSLHQQRQLPVEPLQVYELSGWIRVQGEGDAVLSVVLRAAGDRVTDWSFADSQAKAAADWQRLRTRFVVPPGTKTVHVRLIGHGPATVWVDDVSLKLVDTIEGLRTKGLPERLQVNSGDLSVTFHTADGRLSVTDRRTKATWQQQPGSSVMVLDAKPVERGFQVRLLDRSGMYELSVVVDPKRPEISLELSDITDTKNTKKERARMTTPLTYPPPFLSGKGSFLVMPVNEGISYPVDDESLPAMHYYLYGGHGLCMAWYGVCDGEAGLMTLVETPDDAAVRVSRIDGRLCAAPQWDPQRGAFGPPRRLRYVFIDRGGYVAMCKRYRDYAKQTGLLKTLAEKRKANPNVDLLVGAANVWCWDKDAAAICRELQAAGIGRILWSAAAKPDVLKQLNDMKVLSSRYDIYQDTMNPANFPKLRGIHADWTTDAWPKDLMLRADGDWERGWRVTGKDDQMYPCGVLCDRQAVEYARRRIPAELKTHPYACRFIDTTTASPWRECYSPDHPMTRSESRQWKMKLLDYISGECRLVCGSETGHDAAVPFVHYFEGMLSLGPYRVPDSGRDMQRIWDDVPERVAKFQTGHFYRLPLWELVYHDCVIAQWYWGDYNNKLPGVWDRRDLFNALYGTPPMYMFNRRLWEQNKERFVKSYKAIEPVARATGYSEMLSHRWLTTDHAVQQTQFANGMVVTVNFGDKPFKLADGTALPPLGQRVERLEKRD
jgi:hypothetical protein